MHYTSLVILIFGAVLSSCQSAPKYTSDLLQPYIDEYENCFANDLDNLVNFWTVDNANGNIYWASSGLTKGFIATGFNFGPESPGLLRMLNSDAVIGWVDNNGTLNINDYAIGGTPETCAEGSDGVCTDTFLGGVNNLFNTSGWELEYSGEGGATVSVTHVQWSRKLNTNDPHDVVLGNGNENLKLYSLATGDFLEYHDIGRGYYTQSTTTTPTCPSDRFGNVCSNNGNCTKGCCVCLPGFAKKDCSLDNNVVNPFGPTIIPSEYKFSSQLSPDYKLYWNIDTTLGQISIAVECKCTGWIAFGPSKAGQMINSDIVLGSISNGVVSIDDYWNDNRQFCDPSSGGVCSDSTQHVGGADDIINFNGNENNGVTQLKWIRALKSPHPKGDIDIIDGQMNAIWGFHPTIKAITKHNTNTRLGISINFYTGKVGAGVDLQAIHGTMMFLIWGVTIPAMSFLARYYKRFPWWFNVHRFINGFAIIAMIAAFGVAIASTSSHFTKAHNIVGLIVVIIGLSQPIIGIVADKLFDPKRSKTPIFPDMTHWILGWGGITLGLINIILGLQQYALRLDLLYAYSVYFAIVVSFLIVFAILKLTIWKSDKSH